MKITLIAVGKSKEKYLIDGIKIYQNKLKHYCNLEIIEIKDVEHAGGSELIKEREAMVIAKHIKSDSVIVCLDENGQQFTSESWSDCVQQFQNKSIKNLVFVIGGAFGIHNSLLSQSQLKLSLSKMTFNHEMVRLFFLEQLYRAYTIIRNEKYHNP